METYYARRAAEYEKIYDKPERQADLARMRKDIPALFEGERVLEIACGTGYWTPLIAEQAESVLGDGLQRGDRSPSPDRRPTAGRTCASSAPTPTPCPPGRRSSRPAYAGFWWSHIPFGAHRRISAQSGCRAAGAGRESGVHGQPLRRRHRARRSRGRTREGNTYQSRRLADGSSHEVLKNFPTQQDMQQRLGRFGTDFGFSEYEYYWVATYRIMSPGRTQR